MLGSGLPRSAWVPAKLDGGQHHQRQVGLGGAGHASHTSHRQDLHRYQKARTDKTLIVIELLESLE